MADTTLQFAKGQRVRFNHAAAQIGIGQGGSQTGTVVGFGRNDRLVRVILDGNKTAGTYDHSFFDAESDVPAICPDPPVPIVTVQVDAEFVKAAVELADFYRKNGNFAGSRWLELRKRFEKLIAMLPKEATDDK